MHQKGQVIIEGKTKHIFADMDGDPNVVIAEYKNTITKHDDPAQTREFANKAKYSNQTNCRVFELLKECGVPVAYREQLSDTAFLMERCAMIPVEVVVRRYAVGRMLKRMPHLRVEFADPPHRFSPLLVELFLKTTAGKRNRV